MAPEEEAMELRDVIEQARDALTMKRVFGEPYEKNGVTMVPVARSRAAPAGEVARAPRDRARAREAVSVSAPGPLGSS